MNDTTMTIVGYTVDAPILRQTKAGTAVANFRVGSTARRFDRGTGTWSDSTTLFVTVVCWRALALNVAQSIGKGQPVLVTGRFLQREYERDETVRYAYELEATAVGHDLRLGVTRFERLQRVSVPAGEVDEEGRPADESAHYLELSGGGVEADAGAAEFDEVTGGLTGLAPAR